MEKTFEKKIIDKVTTPIEQVIYNLELLEIADDNEVVKGIIADSLQKLQKAKSEYVKEKESVRK